MLTKKEWIILKRLQNSDFVKSSELEDVLDVSNKTVRKIVLLLGDKVKGYGAEIHSKQGKGYILEIFNQELFDKLHSEEEISFDDPDSRWKYLAKLFIETDSYLKIDDLADSMYVSRKVVSISIKSAEIFFKDYNLHFERKSYSGIKVEGTEYDKRRCMVALAKDSNFFHIDDNLITIVNYIFIKYGITMSQVAKDSFLIHVQYTINRLLKGKDIVMDGITMNFLKEGFFADFMFIARELAKLLEDEYGVDFIEEEIYSIALHISDKKYYEKNLGNPFFDKEISDLVIEILSSIKNTYGLDFENDLDIYTMLVKHIIPLKMRVLNGTVLKNPLLNEIQNQYSFAMSIAKGINPIIEKYFSKRINNDELSYIAVAIQLAIEKSKNKNKRKKNILIICASGSVSSKLFEYRFQEMFKNSIGFSKICNYTDLVDYDFTDIDYAFATIPIDMDLPVPVYQVSEQVLTQKVSNEIQKILELHDDSFIDGFTPSLFFTHLEIESKEELLKFMCDKARVEKNLPNEFYDLVIKREAMLETSYDTYVALPHPYRTVSKETFVCTALLDKSIVWGSHKVKAVFLVAISDDKNVDLENFYERLFDLVLDKEKIKCLLENQSFNNLIELVSKN